MNMAIVGTPWAFRWGPTDCRGHPMGIVHGMPDGASPGHPAVFPWASRWHPAGVPLASREHPTGTPCGHPANIT